MRTLFIILFPLIMFAQNNISIGDYYQGGIVFWINPSDSTDGLICDIDDLGLFEYGCQDVEIQGADGTAIGTGLQNTIDIVNANCETTDGTAVAAELCYNLEKNGYSDWYLPSKDELYELYINSEIVNSSSILNGGSSMQVCVNGQTCVFRSSSESGACCSWSIFPGNSWYAEYKMMPWYAVRAIRSFSTIINSGCMDSSAVNYDLNATEDDGSCCYSTWGNAWNQIGQDIFGDEGGGNGSKAGQAVALSLDGNVLAVGETEHPTNGQGRIRVYSFNSNTWTQIGQDIVGNIGDYIGKIISINGDGSVIAIGSKEIYTDTQYNFGRVWIYKNINNSWVQLGEYIDGVVTTYYLEMSISLSEDGHTLAIGQDNFSDASSLLNGRVRIYNWDGNSWIQKGDDLIGQYYDLFGGSVSLSNDGNTIAIGAYKGGVTESSEEGCVKVYNWNGFSWTQLGLDIIGESPADESGLPVSLSADGSIVAIGAYKADGINGSNSGHVRIFQYDGFSWNQLGQDIDGEAEGDLSGKSISISSDGNTIAIGSEINAGAFNQGTTGHVRIYNYDGTSWSQLGFDLDGYASGDYFGASVSLSGNGNKVAIGAHHNSTYGDLFGLAQAFSINTPCSSGCTDSLALNYDANVFTDDGSCIYPIYGCTDSSAVNFDSEATEDDGSCCYTSIESIWSQIGEDIVGEYVDDGSGYSVAISDDGNTVVIGVPFYQVSGNPSGYVKVYNWDEENWNQLGGDIMGGAGDNAGHAVSVNSNGNIIALSEPLNDGFGNTNAGRVRVYSYNGTNWNQLGQDINGEGVGDQSGSSISLSSNGNILAIGAYRADGAQGDYTGHTRVFNWDGASWVQLGQDIDGDATDDHFGVSVSLSSDGNIVAIGASTHGSNAGHVKVYSFNGNFWVQLGQDIDGVDGDYSGFSTSINNSGNILAIGSPFSNENTGKVKVFEWDGNNWIQMGQDLLPDELLSVFGRTLSLNGNGDILSVGAAPFNTNNNTSGYVRMYQFNGMNWIQYGADIYGDYLYDDQGIVSLNNDGNTVVIGAPGSENGYVRVYGLETLCSTSLCGDVNLDDQVNSQDAALILQYIVGLIDLEDQQIENGDVNNDGSLNSQDASLILQFVVNIIQALNCN